MTVDLFAAEIRAAVASYDQFVICIDKTPQEFEEAVRRLVAKAITAYETRAPGLRHGIALDRQVTVILSQSETDRPLCGIYFNLFSPYHKAGTSHAAANSGK